MQMGLRCSSPRAAHDTGSCRATECVIAAWALIPVHNKHREYSWADVVILLASILPCEVATIAAAVPCEWPIAASKGASSDGNSLCK